LKTHPLITALKSFTGNARGCVLTEPLWGIPYNLYAPYVSVYMVALGMKDTQIGLLLSISWGLQILWALLSGVITDKFGRRRTTMLFDFLSWSAPALVWAFAQNFWFFLAAAVLNSVWRVTHTSWTCLLVEDTDPGILMDMYTWIYIAGLLSAFFAPFASLLISQFTLVPTMRALYLFAAVSFTAKFLLTNHFTTETKFGRQRMHETRNQSVFSALGEYRGVFQQVLHTPQTLYTAAIMLIMSICLMVNSGFWSIIVVERLKIPAEHIALYPFVKSIIMLLFFFVVTPRIAKLPFRIPVIAGMLSFIASQLVLISLPEKSYALLLVSTLLEACAVATINPQLDRMAVLNVDPQERARIMAILYVTIITLTSPFGWIAGELSSISRVLPFVLNIALFAAGAVLAYLAGRSSLRRASAASERQLPTGS
jgi:MFS family permease